MKSISEIFSSQIPIKLEIGAGSKKGENGWITLDKNNDCDINWDLMYGLPFPNQSIDLIYSSHLFEHFYYNDILKLLKECHRVLKDKGTFSISVPNAQLYISAYSDGDYSFWENLPSKYEPAINSSSSLIDIVNYIAYMDGHHKYMFDENNLVNLLVNCNFKNVNLRNFDDEFDPESREFESIYAIGYK